MKVSRFPILCVYPHFFLDRKARPVTVFDDTLDKKIELFTKVMHTCNGVGIAGNQCFTPDAIFLTNVDNNVRVFINPVILEVGGDFATMTEGCLSLPDFTTPVVRNSKVKLQYQNTKGETLVEDFEGFHAIVIQHEMDHINGKTILDNVSKLKYNVAIRHFKKIKKKYGLL